MNYRRMYQQGGRPMPQRGAGQPAAPSAPVKEVSPQEMFNRIVEELMAKGLSEEEAVAEANKVMAGQGAAVKAKDGGKISKKKKKKKSTPKYKDGGTFGVQGGRSPFS